MSQVKTISFESQSWLSAKLSDYGQFIKLRLSGLVVFSACIGYLLGLNGSVEWGTLFIVLLGGMLVTASSNGFNQVIERDTDKLMNRTSDRPLPAGRMNASEGIIAAFLLGAAGIWMLWVMVNPLTGFLSLISLLLYTLAYTPLKKVTPLAVFVGAIPGAMPPLIGWVAATGNIGPAALALYALQFIWQFPHFWSLAWVLDEDYQRAGFKMLPSPDGKGKRTAFQTMVYTLSLIPLALLPQLLGIGNIYSTVILVVCGIYFSHQAFQLYRQCTDDMARRLMFGSFFYLPVTQIALLIGKMFS